MEPAERRDLYQGFGDALSRAVELVVTPALFGLGGHFLDRWLGTEPALTIALAILAVIGMFMRMWYGYDAAMRAQEEAGPWARREAVPMTWPKPPAGPGPAPTTGPPGKVS